MSCIDRDSVEQEVEGVSRLIVGDMSRWTRSFRSSRPGRSISQIYAGRITMTKSLVNIRFSCARPRFGAANQIHGDSGCHACRSGCTTLYRRLSSPPLDPSPLLRPDTPADRALSRSSRRGRASYRAATPYRTEPWPVLDTLTTFVRSHLCLIFNALAGSF